jgi:hypothetical protein
VDGGVDAAAYRQGGVGRVHCGVHCQFRDVAPERDNGWTWHLISVPAGVRTIDPELARPGCAER